MGSNMGEKIKAARKAAGLTQKELAEKMGVKNTTISNYEKGVSRPDADQIEVLCWALGVEPNYFFSGELRTTAPGDLAEYLEDLRERPETRALLEASRGMTKEQVDAMAEMIRKIRGTTDD